MRAATSETILGAGLAAYTSPRKITIHNLEVAGSSPAPAPSECGVPRVRPHIKMEDPSGGKRL